MKAKPTYYVIIPAAVRYCDKLPAGAKLLYGELLALDGNYEGCYARSKYFAELYGVSVRTVQQWLKLLLDNDFIAHVADKEEQTGKRALSVKMRPVVKHKQESYDDIFNSLRICGELRNTFWKFIKHCNLNKRVLTNDKLYDIISRLDMAYGMGAKAERYKMMSLNDAINGGYFDVKEGRDCV